MQFVKPLKPDFLCKVCHEPWDPEAVTSCESCQSTFCRACYDEAMMKDCKCHSCEKQPASFKNVHMLVRSMASNLKVYCRYRSHGCSWEGVRTAFESHVSCCPNKPKEFTYLEEASIPPELLCPICNTPFTDPVQLPCEHVFCRRCIVEALKRNSSCPIDRSEVTMDSMTAPPKLISEILDELPVKCSHHDATVSPCAWTGRRRDYLGHRAMCKGGMPTTNTNPFAGVPPQTPTPTPTPTAVDPSELASVPSQKMTLEPISEFTTIEKKKKSSGSMGSMDDVFVMAHLTAPKLESLEQRKKPLSVSAVLDISGSMSGGKLQMAQESLNFMINELTDRDELGIIAFHTDVERTFSLGKMDEAGKSAARTTVAKLTAKNCTNLSGGLFAGISQVERKSFDREDFDNYYADGGLRKKTKYHHQGLVALDHRHHPKNSSSHKHYDHHRHTCDVPPPRLPRNFLSPEQLKSASMAMSYYTCTVSRNGGPAVYTAGLEISFNLAAVEIFKTGQFTVRLLVQGQTHSSRSIHPTTLQPGQTHKYLWESPVKIQQIDIQIEAPPAATSTTMARCGHNNYLNENSPSSSSSSSSSFHRHTIDLTTKEAAEFNTEEYDFHRVARLLEVEQSKQLAAQINTNNDSSIDRCRAVILFTDGVANGGITSEEGLKRVLKQRVDASPDIVVHTFGFGADHNARMLQGLADIGSGSYYFIQDIATMKESFADCLGGLMSTVAQNIELTIKCSPRSMFIKKVHTSFPVKDGQDGSKIVSLRDVYSAESRDVLVQLSHDHSYSSQVLGADHLSIAEFKLKYDSLLSGTAEMVDAEVVVQVVDNRPDHDHPHPKIDEQRARLELTEALAEARTAADSGDLHLGRENLVSRKEAMKAKHVHSPYFNAMMDDMATVQEQMASTQLWADGGSKHCAAVTSCHAQQRMNRGNMSEAQSVAMGYDNCWKAEMRKKSRK